MSGWAVSRKYRSDGEHYVPKGGLDVTNKHALYILKVPYVVIYAHMIDGIAFNKCLNVAHKEVLEDKAIITHLNGKIL